MEEKACIFVYLPAWVQGITGNSKHKEIRKGMGKQKDSEPSKALRNGPEISKNHENPQNRVWKVT